MSWSSRAIPGGKAVTSGCVVCICLDEIILENFITHTHKNEKVRLCVLTLLGSSSNSVVVDWSSFCDEYVGIVICVIMLMYKSFCMATVRSKKKILSKKKFIKKNIHRNAHAYHTYQIALFFSILFAFSLKHTDARKIKNK